MEIRTYKGKWWILSNPKDQLSGYLTIHPNGEVNLELIGAFELEENGIDLKRVDTVIYGHCFSPDNKAIKITLLDCHAVPTLNPSLPFPIVNYICRYALIGIHTESMNALSFFKAQIHFDELTYWCPPKLFRTECLE